MFLANPDKYAVTPYENKQSSSATPTATQLVNIEGKSCCAACDHGVVPMSAPDQLGLAVKAKNGTIYVVENAHKLYPKVYEARFEGLPLTVTGHVIKRDGKIAWIRPTRLKILWQLRSNTTQ